MGKIHSSQIELVRTGPPHNQLLSPALPYVALSPGKAPVTVFQGWEHQTWLRRLRDLRYDADPYTRDDRREEALSEVAAEVTRLLTKAHALEHSGQGEALRQLRLVITPLELAAMPFELATGASGAPLVIDSTCPTEITREVREAGDVAPAWSGARVRVLYAFASTGSGVPYREHLAALAQALRPWAKPNLGAGPGEVQDDFGPLLTVLANASLVSLRTACDEAIRAGKAYTHVHLLAHGAPVGGDMLGQFGLALFGAGDEVEVVTGDKLAAALVPPSPEGVRPTPPMVVTLASCDSAGTRSVIPPGAGLVQQVHQANIALVVGSQFPLTKAGSVVLVQTLYAELLAGTHPLRAVRCARSALYARGEENHDWASMVVYTRFPDDLDHHVHTAKAKRIFARMKVSEAWVERAAEGKGEGGPEVWTALKSRMEEILRALEDLTSQLDADGAAPALRCEAWGLLGSTHKRLAEVAWHASTKQTDKLCTTIRDHFKFAKRAYQRGAEADVTDHWTAVQATAMGMLLEPYRLGSKTRGPLAIRELERLRVALWYAEADTSKELWGRGSRYELGLLGLAGALGRNGVHNDAYTLDPEQNLSAIRDDVGGDPWDSAKRQLKAYAGWWWDAREILPGAATIGKGARDLAQKLGIEVSPK